MGLTLQAMITAGARKARTGKHNRRRIPAGFAGFRVNTAIRRPPDTQQYRWLSPPIAVKVTPCYFADDMGCHSVSLLPPITST
ncbi:MAG: hypothetical protein M1294_06035 [Firmicutes bacterium]|nr:hypothetical protein [Bacillota bacterium]